MRNSSSSPRLFDVIYVPTARRRPSLGGVDNTPCYLLLSALRLETYPIAAHRTRQQRIFYAQKPLLCREGGEYNTRKGNKPGRLLAVFEPLGTIRGANFENSIQ